MNKLFKWLLVVIGTVVALIVIAAVVLPLVIDPNDYRQEISDRVQQQTGRDLTIGADIKWSVFPWVGLDLVKITLDNRKGYGEQPMLSIGHAAVSVKLMPLFHQQIELGKVSLDDISVHLRRDAGGGNNWDDLGAAQAQATTDSTPGGSGIKAFKVAKIEIHNANISWEDAGQTTKLKGFHLTASNIELGQPFNLQGGFSVNLPEADLNGEATFGGLIRSTADGAHYGVEGLKLAFEGQQGKVGEAIALNMKVSANADVDLGSNQAKLADFEFRLNNLALQGQLNVRQLTSDPHFAGDFKITAFSPRQLLTSMGIEAPQTSLATALTSLQAEMHIAGTSNSIELQNIHIRLDQSNFEGQLKVVNFERPRLAFNFRIDQLNLDDYTATTEGQSGASDLPVEVFRGFTGGGELNIGKLGVAGLTATDIKLTMNSDGQTIRFYPMSSHFYGGQQQGEIRIDASGEHPLLVARQELSGVQAQSLLQDLTGSARLQGTGNLSLDISTDLTNDLTTRQALAGNIGLNFHDGAIVGIDVAESIRQAKAMLGRSAEKPQKNGPEKKTDFSELSMTAIIRQGIASSDDLMIRSPILQVTGKGRINLVDETINYHVKPVVMDNVEGQDNNELADIKGVPIPIKLSGNLYEPDIAIDIVGAMSGAQKAKINKKKKQLKNRIFGKIMGQDDQPETGSANQGSDGKTVDPGKHDNGTDALLQGLFGSKHSKNKKKTDKNNVAGDSIR